jgi:hypothetical protein
MCGDVLPAEHRRRGSGGALLRFAATSTRTTPATATATLRRGQWAASLVVRRAITGRPGAAGVLAEDMEGAMGAVGRLLASPHARDQEAGRTLATDLLARQPLPPGGGAPSALLGSARCSPSVLQAIATNSPAEVRTPQPPLLLPFFFPPPPDRTHVVVVVVIAAAAAAAGGWWWWWVVVVMAGAHRSFLSSPMGRGTGCRPSPC